MITPEKWNRIFDPKIPAKPRFLKARVAGEARRYLNSLAPGMMIGTHELVEALYPIRLAERSLAGDRARTGIFALLALLARKGLDDCCIKGEGTGKKYMGHIVRPWIWFCPDDTEYCKKCGQIIPPKPEGE